MRVSYDHQIFSAERYGGVARYFHELAKRVNRAQDMRASIIAPLYINRYLTETGAPMRGLRVPEIPKMGVGVRVIDDLISSAAFRLSPPDLLHETYYRPKSLAPRGCPVVVTVHDMIHEKFNGSFGAADQTSASKRSAVARADRVICVSEHTRADLIQMFDPDPQKIKTIHHGFSVSRTADPEIVPDVTRPYFLYVGQRTRYKNFGNLLTAYASSQRLRSDFDLVAFGATPFTQKEIVQIRAHGLSSAHIRYLSGDDALLGFLYRNATALVYPSIYEGFGIPPLEAMSLECPVLCSNTSSIPEVVAEAGLYFDPSRIEAIREAMETLASSAELGRQLRARGLARAEHFSWDKCASETVEVYRELHSQ